MKYILFALICNSVFSNKLTYSMSNLDDCFNNGLFYINNVTVDFQIPNTNIIYNYEIPNSEIKEFIQFGIDNCNFIHNFINYLNNGNITYSISDWTSCYKSGEFYLKDAVFSFDTQNNISYKYYIKEHELKEVQKLGNDACNFINKFIFYGIIILISLVSLCYLYYIRKYCHCNNKNESNNS